jgi:hypothetical protein
MTKNAAAATSFDRRTGTTSLGLNRMDSPVQGIENGNRGQSSA